MRLSAVAVAALVFCIARPAVAQEWTEYVNQGDRFSTVFPGQPQITETTFASQFGADLPARVYSAEVGPGRYSVTVVDYSPIEAILTEKAKACPLAPKPAGAVRAHREILPGPATRRLTGLAR